MTSSLLLRGMIVGVIAGILVFLSAHWLGEPQVDRSIAFENAAAQARGEAPEAEVFSRRVQKTAGLLTATVGFGAALGGIFGLVFAFTYGRFGPSNPRALAALLGFLGFVAIAFVPTVKYPASPPAVGLSDTIGMRTAAFFLMVLASIAAIVFSSEVASRLSCKFGIWSGTLLGAAAFIALTALAAHFLPSIDEVPAAFPADVLWRFRLSSWALQLILWATIGLLFGWLTERDPRWSRFD
ncbi:putative cobalt transporter CbtA [Acidisarcina polymorpha]|uniref:Putative cobalt transporter CbtA n=1 Tax=Acidisarcina polymorpha TaxID=2211140 RepID=A0A2Z5G5T4_9BACT|nr:CbtA family protein [Acidisarcina polymorpha]AXC14350.1 putative cobalt transporter CbtA [Acidisarcina polymorpha]